MPELSKKSDFVGSCEQLYVSSFSIDPDLLRRKNSSAN